MGTPYPEDAEDTFDFTAEGDWQEVIDSGALPSSVHLSNDAQEAVLVGYVPWNKQRSAARYFLGFAHSDTESPWRLRREPPAEHPAWPWLYAYDVSFTPFVPKANVVNPDSQPKFASPFVDNAFVAYAEKVVATVRYRSFRMEFLDDDSIDANADEWRRWAFFEPDPRIEALSVTGSISQLTFAEGGGAPAPVGGTTRFTAPMAELLAKTGYTLNWFSVPWEYLSDDDEVFHPAKILSCVGTVNSVALFDGKFPAGTMLLEPPKFAFKPYAVANADDNRLPLWAVDVQLPWVHFDPAKGVPTSAYHGWNLMPWSGDGTAATPGDGKFYYATRGGATTADVTTDATLIRYTDHTAVFRNVNE